MKKQNAREKIKFLTMSAVFAALIVIVSFVPIKTLGLEITLSMVPIAVGAVCFGEYMGLALGAVFGIVSFLQCLGYSQFGAMLLQINPFFTFLVCVPTRMLAGYLGGLIARLIIGKNTDNNGRKTAGFAVGSLLCPLLNTLFFMSTLVLLFYNSEYISGFATALNAANPVHFIVLFVGINGIVELACGAILALPCSLAVSKYLHRR